MTRPRIDPDPFSIVVGTAGIVSGLASVVSLYQQFFGHSPTRSVAQIKRVLQEAKDVVRYIEVDVQILQEIVKTAEISGDRGFRPGRRAFLSPEQFKRYETTADQLMGRLRKVLKATHRLDRLLPHAPGRDLADTAIPLESIQGRLERLIRDRDLTVDSAMQDLRKVLQQVGGLIDDLSSLMDSGHQR